MSVDTPRIWGEGTVSSPHFKEAYDETHDDLRLSGRYYSFDTPEGLVAGATISITCTINRPAREVWPYFKDHTPWQEAFNYYYSGIIGDLEGQSFALGNSPTDFPKPRYDVLRVI